MAVTLKASLLYYTSQDVLVVDGRGTIPLPTWSVYVEAYTAPGVEPAAYKHVSTHASEAEANYWARTYQAGVQKGEG